MMLEDKLYDMFAYILYGGMMLLLLITPFLAEDTKGAYSWIKFGPEVCNRRNLLNLLRLWLWLNL